MTELPEPYQGMSSEELRAARKAIQEFLLSEGFKLYKRDYEGARDQSVEVLTGMVPEGVKDFVLREQAVGQLEQIKAALDWFEAKDEEIKQLLTEE